MFMIRVYVKKQGNFAVNTPKVKKKLQEYFIKAGIVSNADVSLSIVGEKKMISLAHTYLKENNISTDNHSEEIHKLIIEHDLNKITEKQFLQECSKILGIIIPYPKYKYAYKKNSLNKDLIEIIQKLKDKYKIALLTNNNKEYCQEYLFKPKLDKLFDIMVISYLVGYRKPDSNIYKILIKKLNLKPEEILFVDDDPTKMASAEALGIKTLVYKGKETNKILSNLS